MNNKQLLDAEIRRGFEKLNTLEADTEEYKSTVETLLKLIDRANTMEQLEIDKKDKMNAREYENGLRLMEIKEERIYRIGQTILAAAGIIIPTIVTVWGTKASFEFEKEGNVTTIMGRGFVSSLIPKKK